MVMVMKASLVGGDDGSRLGYAEFEGLAYPCEMYRGS